MQGGAEIFIVSLTITMNQLPPQANGKRQIDQQIAITTTTMIN
jgi:hypothetical protein